MTRTYGEYDVTLDTKDRIMLPAGYKKQLPENERNTFMLTKGNGPFIILYTLSQWKKVEDTIDTINDNNEESLEMKINMLSGVSPIETDAGGRIVISKRMLAHAGITKNIVMQGMSDKMFLWNTENYEKVINAERKRQSELTNKILGAHHLKIVHGNNTQQNG